jgi:hypothetical protein
MVERPRPQRAQDGNSQGWGGSYRGVPGPVVGAGLPIIAAGYGVYWLIRRRRCTLQKIIYLKAGARAVR